MRDPQRQLRRPARRTLGLAVALLALVVGSGARMAGVGVTIGLMLSAALTRLLASLLYGVTPLDPLAFAGAAAILVMTALLACVTPALLALRTDLAVTLRQE